ncbi:MAG: deoxyribose-phosphate aldolase [Gammaproteobacteria bacterium]|nr:deoxyribose-phosphate aldolase [Gammaproteobacteria bacterium]
MPDDITSTGSSAFARRGRRSPATPETRDGRPSARDVPVPSDETAHSNLAPWNPGTPLELDWLRHLRVNRSAAERRGASLPGRRSVKREWQAAWLLRAVTCIDLTTLAGDDTPGRVHRLCGKARNPVRADLLEAAGAAGLPIQVASVCVYPSMVATAVEVLAGSGIPVAAVAAGFPAGQTPFPERLDEIRTAVAAGASEIDIVISRELVLRGRWGDLYDEVGAFREAARGAHLKTIIATGELATLTNVARASLVCMMAGADFIKTSTGKERVNATLPVGLTMVRQIRAWRERTGYRVGFKPAGGIGTAKQALVWLVLLREELGPSWMQAGLFRFGASSLLGDIERQIEHYVTGRYSATHRHPMA